MTFFWIIILIIVILAVYKYTKDKKKQTKIEETPNQTHENKMEETKKCPQCQKDVSAKAKKCPYCQSDLGDWKSKRIGCGSVIGILIIIVVSYAFISSILSNDSSTKKTTPTTQQNAEQSSTPTIQEDLLELVSFRCYTEYDYFHIVGEVKNISDKSLEDVVAVGNAYTQDGEFVKSDDTLIDYNPILAGQTSPFEVLMTGNPAIKKCKVSFKEFWGGTIPTKTE